MNSERNDWHSDDDLASALERALDVPQGEVHPIAQSSNSDSNSSIDDLFASLVAEDASAPSDAVAPPAAPSVPVVDAPPFVSEPVVAAPDIAMPVVDNSAVADEQVFESLDDFKPRTNFIPVQAPIDEVVVAEAVEVTETVVVQPASSQVTMPVQWTPHRRSFDEIVFGSAPTN